LAFFFKTSFAELCGTGASLFLNDGEPNANPNGLVFFIYGGGNIKSASIKDASFP
jgi:hypothetical protein